MNKYILLSFALGAAAGAIGANMYLQGKYEALLQEEVESIKGAIERQSMQKARIEARQDFSKMSEMVGDYQKEEGQVIYDKEDLGGIVAVDNPTEDGYLEPTTGEPYVISCDQYTDENIMYDKLELQFYTGDGCLVDERDDLVSDFMYLLGADPVVLLAEAEDPSVIYVRNEQMGADFEIQVNECEWSDTISGKRGGD